MNILLIIEGTYPWYRGGVSEWVYQYIKKSSHIKFDVVQIATDPFINVDLSNALYPIPENILSFQRIPAPELNSGWSNSLNEWFWSSLEFLDRSSFNNDLVHVTNTGFAGWLGMKLATENDLPFVLTEHALYWLEVEKGAVALECGYKIPTTLKGKAEVVNSFKDIATQIYLTADEIISVSECNIPYQLEFGASDVRYIPNGIPKDWLINTKIHNSIPTIGWVGRCAEMKNPLEFFDFIDHFRAINFDASYLMLLSDANETELAEKVNQRAKEYENLTLVWDQPAKDYYQRMDMLLITSHNESQPLVMFEALANEVLPIGRRVGDVNNNFAFTFESESSLQEITYSIAQFWHEKESFYLYLNERIKRIKAEHTWEIIFEKYSQIFENLKTAGNRKVF